MTLSPVLVGAIVVALLLLTILELGKGNKLKPISKERLIQLKGPLLLVVDDSVTIQKVIELTFSDTDLTPVGVSSAADALKFLQQREFAAALVDVFLPLEQGYDLCELMKLQKPDLPVILLVGSFETFDQERFENSGAVGVIKKPFDSQEILSSVGNVIAKGE